MFRGVAHRPPRTRLVEARAHAEYCPACASSSEHDTLPGVDAGQAFHRRIQWPPLLKLICLFGVDVLTTLFESGRKAMPTEVFVHALLRLRGEFALAEGPGRHLEKKSAIFFYLQARA